MESATDGYLLAVNGAKGDTLEVGSILAWIGATADEPVTAERAAPNRTEEGPAAAPTLRALIAAESARSQDRGCSVYRAGSPQPMWSVLPRAGAIGTAAHRRPRNGPSPPWADASKPFTPEQKGMARTVTWHRDEAAAGYIELAHDPQPWEIYAAEFQKSRGLLLNPLLSLMAWRLAKLAAENPRDQCDGRPPGCVYIRSGESRIYGASGKQLVHGGGARCGVQERKPNSSGN